MPKKAKDLSGFSGPGRGYVVLKASEGKPAMKACEIHWSHFMDQKMKRQKKIKKNWPNRQERGFAFLLLVVLGLRWVP